MSRLNSSTSNSDQRVLSSPASQRIRDVLVIGAWMILTFIASDVLINVLFPVPADVNVVPSRMRAYFDYGRSIEGKVLRTAGTSDATAAPIAKAGWLNELRGSEQPTRPRPGSDLLLATYGMSFSADVANALAKIDPKVTLRTVGGPGAPPNCAYKYYLNDRGKHQADVVMLGILSNRVAAMESTSGMNNSFEGPAPYTYPRFVPDGSGGLRAIEPTIRSLAELRSALTDASQHKGMIDEMRHHDAYYASYLFDHNLFDYSALARMVRRAVAHGHDRAVESRSYNEAGFVADSLPVTTLRLMVREFAASVRADGKVPVVLLLHTRGYSDHLYAILAETLATDDVPYVSTHTVCPASDVTNYIADGHFTDQANEKIAAELAKLIASRLPGRGKRTETVMTDCPVDRCAGCD